MPVMLDVQSPESPAKGKDHGLGRGDSITHAVSVSTKTCPPEMQQASVSVRDSCTRMVAVGTGLNGLEWCVCCGGER